MEDGGKTGGKTRADLGRPGQDRGRHGADDPGKRSPTPLGRFSLLAATAASFIHATWLPKPPRHAASQSLARPVDGIWHTPFPPPPPFPTLPTLLTPPTPPTPLTPCAVELAGTSQQCSVAPRCTRGGRNWVGNQMEAWDGEEGGGKQGPSVINYQSSIYPSPVVHHPSSIIHRPLVHHPSPITHRPSSITHHSSSFTRHPSSMIPP